MKVKMRARSGARNDEESERLQRQDLTLARGASYYAQKGLRKSSRPCANNPLRSIRSTTTTSRHHQVHPSSNPPSIRILYRWRPLALSPRHDLLRCGRGYEPVGECLIRLRKSGRILSRPPTHDPFDSSLTHHSFSTP